MNTIDEFYRSHCLRCYNYQKKYKEEHKEQQKARDKEYRENNKEYIKQKQKEKNPERRVCEYCKWDVLTHTCSKQCKSQNHLLNIKMIEEGLDEKYNRQARDEVFRGVSKS